jgi:hypothetical protein
MAMATSETEARQELTTHFGSAVADHPDVMGECRRRLLLLQPVSGSADKNRLVDTSDIQYRPVRFVLQIRSIRHVSSIWLESKAVDIDSGYSQGTEKGDSERTSGKGCSHSCWIACAQRYAEVERDGDEKGQGQHGRLGRLVSPLDIGIEAS